METLLRVFHWLDGKLDLGSELCMDEEGIDDPAAVNRYRDSDELRYTLFSPSFRATSPSLPLPLL
ncbi:hypothetical protein NGA_0428000, partial [Nannochloropsis gaditana CCMP526]|uniref:uncharacterized protein n=1 Tax=Nannochloropsis gaditana (strain CCMP526) TaxID=1093141 RepID=UPI00029F6D67